MNGPRVRSQAEYGYEGALAQTQRYGKPAVDRWRRMGGRKAAADVDRGPVAGRTREAPDLPDWVLPRKDSEKACQR